jgi:hypothetical protein
VAFCMAKAAKQKSRGSYKYKGCVMTLANKVQMPHITARLGFLPVAATLTGKDGQNKKVDTYRVSKGSGWVTRVVAQLKPLPAVCTLPGTTKCM